MFSIEKKQNFEPIGNFAHSIEFLILGKAILLLPFISKRSEKVLRLKIIIFEKMSLTDKLASTAQAKPRFQSPNFEFINELGKIMSKSKFHC